MLNRLRNMVKRLELPEEEQDVVYRIIDDNLNAVEVPPAQYVLWSMQNDVSKKAVVGQDVTENVRVWTTFSIMPENRSYKPFGTHAFNMTQMEPLAVYSRRYDSWREAERGHKETLELIRRDYTRARVAEVRAESLAGTAGEVRLAISADVPSLFRLEQRSDSEIAVLTPLLRADGTAIELLISDCGSGFTLSVPARAPEADSGPSSESPAMELVEQLFGVLGVSVESGSVTCTATDPSQLARAMLRLAQAVACLSYLPNDGR